MEIARPAYHFRRLGRCIVFLRGTGGAKNAGPENALIFIHVPLGLFGLSFSCPAFSDPAFSRRAISMVRHFHPMLLGPSFSGPVFSPL